MNASKASIQRLGWSLEERDPRTIESLMPMWSWFYHHYFRVKTDGWHHIPAQTKVLLVGSHNGGLAAPDMSMMMYDWFRRFGTERLVYGLMHPHVWKVYPELAQLAAQVGAVMAHPKMAIAAFRKGASVLVYPGGAQDLFRPYHQRQKIHFAGRQGFIKLALWEGVPIVPVISHGAHDTLFVLGDCYEQARQLHEWGMLPWLFGIDPQVFPIYLGLPWGLAIGPLPNIPLPVTMHTRICTPIVFEHYGRTAASNRDYVNACYQKVCSQMQCELDRLVEDIEEGKEAGNPNPKTNDE
ncbi:MULTISPECIES: lysophospholipid acyltransferase family protein [unclassified Coleofasciculus]|uniref:lysophospholipid acyltransferase family protein n=1 Tax=unclassified Coleofasciculus TaxID=2692782 RepID=UPI00187E8B41|nr:MULTISPECIES: lysophospholipid acyltransferase family protein [unclassified Coleofasciculus]MBE9128872.1 acyltransferase family protein [Coleofasciculus sp. LEGE 07081]MBE9151593.1 acyltransferase family protein [Coleofasciculus sp. LEGE 07092]